MQRADKQALLNLIADDRLSAQFIELTAVDTKSDESRSCMPSTEGQLELAKKLQPLCQGLAEKCTPQGSVKLTSKGALLVHLPACPGCEPAPALVVLAHLDTAPDCSGAGVSPALVTAYQGQGIELENGLILDEQICPELADHIGDDIIVTDGRTLLGADDKAGCAVMLELLKRISEGQLRHGSLYLVFTVDEEIGRSFDSVPLDLIKADFAVTIDGCELGELDVATFNALSCQVSIKGRSIHTGSACGKLINALKIAAEFVSLLPQNEAPETTSGLEGFYHPYHLEGSVEQACVSLILRDFEMSGLNARREFVQNLCRQLNERYGGERVSAEFYLQYRNFAEVLKHSPGVLHLCREAYAKAGIAVHENYVRGGTDGSNLSYAGLPCPNIFTGALNCHGPYECLPVPSLHKSLACVQALVELTANEERSALFTPEAGGQK